MEMKKSIPRYGRHWKPKKVTEDSRAFTSQTPGFLKPASALEELLDK